MLKSYWHKIGSKTPVHTFFPRSIDTYDDKVRLLFAFIAS